MKKIITPMMAAACLAVGLTACKKDSKPTAQDGLSESTLAQIRALGFSSDGAKAANGGYLVEGDILLSDQDLASKPSSPNMIVAKEEQYRTFNLVSVAKHATIKVALNNSSAQHDAAFSAALDEAILRYNNENL